MKKFLAIFMLCFAVFAANAQVFLLQESFDDGVLPAGWTAVDVDGDGYNWAVDADESYAEGTSHTGNGLAYSASYVNYVGPLNSDQWLITSAVQIPATANQPTLSWWTRSSYGDAYEVYISTTGNQVADFGTTPLFSQAASTNYTQAQLPLDNYLGQTIYVAFRHNFTDGFYLFLDDVEIFTIPTEPTISVSPASVNFGTVFVNETLSKTVNVSGFNLTSPITVSTNAPFAVSLNDTTFSTSVSLPAAGGTLYVQYAPTAVVPNNGTVTFTSGEATATVALTGEGFECTTVTTFPYETNFTNATLNECWTVEDANADDYTWEFSTSGYASIRWNASEAMDDWLISPVFALTGNEYTSFQYSGNGNSYPEKFVVCLIQGTTRTLISDTIVTSGSSYSSLVLDLRSYTGNYQIGIHGVSDANMYRLYVKDFMVASATPAISLSDDEIDFGVITVGNTSDDNVVVSTINVTAAVAVSTVAPFSVSLDGESFAATASIPATTDLSNATTVYVRYAPTAAVEDEGMVVFTAGTLTDTLFLAGEGFECTNVTSFPYTTDFTEETKNLCWTIEDANNDDYTFSFNTSGAYASYSFSSSNAANDWLISPVFVLTGNEYATFKYMVNSASYPEKFEVYVIQGETRTLVVNEMTVTNDEYADMQPIDLTSYTGEYQIGIHCTSDADMWKFMVTDFKVDNISNLEASLTVNPASINFGALIYSEGVTASRTATVSAVVITDNIAVTTTTPFAVSLDGTTYTDSVTIIPTGISSTTTLYVQYAPTAVGTNNGSVNLTAGTHTATIALNGSAVACDNAATLPFTEDFEGGVFPPECWILESTNEITWTSKVSENDNSTWAYCNYAETAQDEKLITKTIDFTTDQNNVTMTFDFIASYYYVTNEDPAEQYNLLIYASTDNGATFSSTPVYDMRNDQGEFENWTVTSASVDLSSLIGQTTVKLMFNYYGTYGGEMWIDNISINPTTVGIEEETAENAVSIYPNPASTMLNVHAENFDNVQVINFLGQVVYSANVTENDFQINVSNLSNGVYFLRLNGENTVTKKFVKK